MGWTSTIPPSYKLVKKNLYRPVSMISCAFWSLYLWNIRSFPIINHALWGTPRATETSISPSLINITIGKNGPIYRFISPINPTLMVVTCFLFWGFFEAPRHPEAAPVPLLRSASDVEAAARHCGHPARGGLGRSPQISERNLLGGSSHLVSGL